MKIALALERFLQAAGPARVLEDPRVCRQRMRLWALRWRAHRAQEDQWALAELALGNALGWRDRATWGDV